MCWYGCVDESLCVWYGCVDESLCVGMHVYVGVDELLCVGMGVWRNHCVLVWVCG